MPKIIVGFVVAMFMATSAFAEIEGEGTCRAAWMLWDWIYNGEMNHACTRLNYGDCPDICSAYDVDYSDCYNSCQQLFDDMNAVNDLCYAADGGEVHKDVWLEYARTWCDYPYQMPYHLRFGNVANPEDSEEILYGAFEDLAFADNQTTVRCYNGDSDNGMTTRYLTVCDCAGRMDDLYSWYDYCSTSIYEEDEINTCILGDDGMTTLLCVPFEEAFNNDGCSNICFCEGSDGEQVAGEWHDTGNGRVYSSVFEFIDLNSGRAESVSNSAALAFGCSYTEFNEWACQSGYYMSGANVCSACPSHSSGAQTSSYANMDDVSACYVPVGKYSDTTGAYEIGPSNCEYKK